MSAASNHGGTPYYFVPGPSGFPAMAALGLFFVILGAGQWVNGHGWGAYSLLAGLVIWLGTLYRWFATAIHESETGQYSDRIDVSFRWSMSWFIFSEVMFFSAFFGALYWARMHAGPVQRAEEGAEEHHFREDEPAHAPAERDIHPVAVLATFAFTGGITEPLAQHDEEPQQAEEQGVLAPRMAIHPLAGAKDHEEEADGAHDRVP